MRASSNSNPSSTIISCSSPANVQDETDIIIFYKELFYLFRRIPKHNFLIIGPDETNKFCLQNSSNRNGYIFLTWKQTNMT